MDVRVKHVIREMAVFDELDTSVKLIKLGLGELQNIGNGSDFYFLPFQLLSQGFERFMKVFLCLLQLKETGSYPDKKFLLSLGHDLEKLLRTITTGAFTSDRPILKDDLAFLSGNKDIAELLYILSEFGKLARYHNFDLITDTEKKSVNPRELWSGYRSRKIDQMPGAYQQPINWETQYEVTDKLSRDIVILFERFVIAIGRQFSFGTLGDKGRQLSVQLTDFTMLRANELGKTDYRKHTTRYSQKRRKVHKRNLADFIFRHIHPSFHHRTIRRKDYSGEWPFYTDVVTVECRYGHWCIVTIEGKDYALNGAAIGRYKLESPHDAGMAILGMPVSSFTSIALELGRDKTSANK